MTYVWVTYCDAGCEPAVFATEAAAEASLKERTCSRRSIVRLEVIGL